MIEFLFKEKVSHRSDSKDDCMGNYIHIPAMLCFVLSTSDF